MRRRFGVRDKDRRPFSVAWASQKLDGQASARFTHGDQPHAQPMPPTFPTEDYNLRHRVPQASGAHDPPLIAPFLISCSVNHNVLNGVSPSVHLFSEYQHHISPPGPSAYVFTIVVAVSTINVVATDSHKQYHSLFPLISTPLIQVPAPRH